MSIVAIVSRSEQAKLQVFDAHRLPPAKHILGPASFFFPGMVALLHGQILLQKQIGTSWTFSN